MMGKKTLKNVTVADAYLAILADRGVDYMFANAGTDFAPMIEALAKAQALGTPHPEPITCPHENTAQHMAIGYYLVTGRPQLTMMHVNVGTANGMMVLQCQKSSLFGQALHFKIKLMFVKTVARDTNQRQMRV